MNILRRAEGSTPSPHLTDRSIPHDSSVSALGRVGLAGRRLRRSRLAGVTAAPRPASTPSTIVEGPWPPLTQRQPAPEFQTGLDWINVARPLTLGELRGKIVLLDFWTYG